MKSSTSKSYSGHYFFYFSRDNNSPDEMQDRLKNITTTTTTTAAASNTAKSCCVPAPLSTFSSFSSSSSCCSSAESLLEPPLQASQAFLFPAKQKFTHRTVHRLYRRGCPRWSVCSCHSLPRVFWICLLRRPLTLGLFLTFLCGLSFLMRSMWSTPICDLLGFYGDSSNSGTTLDYFVYPLDVNLHQLLQWHQDDDMDKFLNVTPVQLTPYHFRLLPSSKSNNGHCPLDYAATPEDDGNHNSSRPLRLLIAVKTVHSRWFQRQIIRNTWGNSECYPSQDIQVAVVFLFGLSQINPIDDELLLREHQIHGDIVQQNFEDNYYNNTLKVLMALKYASNYCNTHPNQMDFFLLVDDDYFVNPASLSQHVTEAITQRERGTFVGGSVIYHAVPYRVPWSKWFMPHRRYPYQVYPDYPSGGFILMSSAMVHDLHIVTRFVEYFPYDDVYLGFVLFKLHIAPTHIPKVLSNRPVNFTQDLIASHGYKQAKEQIDVWCHLRSEKKCHTNYRQPTATHNSAGNSWLGLGKVQNESCEARTRRRSSRRGYS